MIQKRATNVNRFGAIDYTKIVMDDKDDAYHRKESDEPVPKRLHGIVKKCVSTTFVSVIFQFSETFFGDIILHFQKKLEIKISTTL